MTEIKNLRKKAHMTQGQLARCINASQSAIAKWETGESKPRAEKLPKLAKILDCSIEDLLRSPERVG